MSIYERLAAMPEEERLITLEYLPTHLADQGEIGGLYTLLTMYDFLEAKMDAMGVEPLLEDYQLAKDFGGDSGNHMLQQIDGALRAGVVILKQAPEELWNQIKGRTDLALPVSHPRPTPRFDLRFATLGPVEEALVRIFSGHTDKVNYCDFSPDGKLVLSASEDHTLRLWDVATGKTQHVLRGHRESVQSCAFHPNGKLAVSASADCTLRLWNVATGETERVLYGHRYSVSGCAFTSDGQYLVSNSGGLISIRCEVRIWDLKSGNTIHVFKGNWLFNRFPISQFSISPDGKYILSDAPIATMKLWDLHTGKTVKVFRWKFPEKGWRGWWLRATTAVSDCAFSPDGQKVLASSILGKNILQIWDVSSRRAIHLFEGHDAFVYHCVFSPDSKHIISASNDNTLRMWEVDSGKIVKVFRGHSKSVRCCVFSPKGEYILSSSDDHSLRLWATQSNTSRHAVERHRYDRYGAVVGDCCISPDGIYGMSSSEDTFLWEMQSAKIVHKLNDMHGFAFSPDGRMILCRSSADQQTILLQDVNRNQTLQVFKGHKKEITFCAFHPSGNYILSASWDKQLILWDIHTGKIIRTYEGHTDAVYHCAFSPNGNQILSASRDGTLRIWETVSGESKVLRGHQSMVWFGLFSPNGQSILSASMDQTLRFWDVSSSNTLHVFYDNPKGVRPPTITRIFYRESMDSVHRCVFLPDGKHFFSTSENGTLSYWDIAAEKIISCWITDAALRGCAYHPGSSRLLVGDDLGGVHFLRFIPERTALDSGKSTVEIRNRKVGNPTMDDNAIFRMLYGPGPDRRTQMEKVHDRRKCEIASALRQKLGGFTGSPLYDSLWRFCLLATEVFLSDEYDIEEFVDRAKRDNPGGDLDAALTRTRLTDADVAAFLLQKFPHYHGDKGLPLSQDVAEHFGDVLATFTPSEHSVFKSILQPLMRESMWDRFSREEQLKLIERIIKDIMAKR